MLHGDICDKRSHDAASTWDIAQIISLGIEMDLESGTARMVFANGTFNQSIVVWKHASLILSNVSGGYCPMRFTYWICDNFQA